MALVIGRRVGETIRIGKDVEIMVTRLLAGQVRLAIQAPREIEVVRGELLHGRRLRCHDAAGKN
jgi:carbon storage regulator